MVLSSSPSRCGSEVEHTLGKGGVESSILSSGTIFLIIQDFQAFLKSAIINYCLIDLKIIKTTMARRKTPTLKNTLLPEAVIFQFRRRLRQVIGLMIGMLALTFAITLLSYSPHDPSLNTATTAPVKNMLSLPGAIIADFFIQGFGLASILLIVVVITWGIFLIAEAPIRRFSIRLTSLILSLVTLATFLGLFTNKAIYLVTPTLGGACGALSLAAIVRMTGLMPAAVGFINLVFFILFFGYSLGIRSGQWQQILHAVSTGFAALGSAVVKILVIPAMHLGRKLFTRKNSFATPFTPKTEAPQAPFLDRKSIFILKNENQSCAYTNESLPEQESFDIQSRDDAMDCEGKIEFSSFGNEPESVIPDKRIKKTIKQPITQTTSSATEFIYSLPQSEDYQLPSLEFLQKTIKKDGNTLAPEVLQQSAHQLEQVLQEFGVRGEIVAVCPGPVVTLYELKPAPGIKTSRVIGLADDIARSMSAHAARIAVIPGRNVIGIELPNPVRETVYLRELLQSDDYTKFSAPLALVLGKDIGGNPIIADLARMPHLLVAGTTGSGKSVSINTMILSLLFRLSPDKCKFIMIDPKMLELSVYDGIPHLLSPVVTDPKKAVVALKWAVREMENRYRAMSKLGVRNIDGYNTRLAEARHTGELLMRRVQTGFDPDTGKPIFENQSLAVDPLPYIVVVVDEMADLMLVAGKEIEAAVQRLAQMARAAGIHLIMATQRPSVDVITGTIKANFPTRISFQVTSKIDSRTILGEQGAEQLLGQGDMLYMMGGGRLSRVHGPFVRDDEVEKIVQFLKMQGEPSYIESITEDEEEMGSGSGEEENRNGDPLYQQAIEIIRREGKVSTSFIQRHLQIGYNRAARIIEQMEKEGIVGPANHVGKREIL